MGYGNDSVPAVPASVRKENVYPGGSTVTFNNFSGWTPKSWSRSGTNTAKRLSTVKSAPPTRLGFVPRVVKLKGGPKTDYQVFDSRTGRVVWQRDYLASLRLIKRQQRDRKRARRGLDLLPNRLNFSEEKLLIPQDTQTVVGVASGGYSRVYSGNLWAPWIPLGTGSAFGPDPSSLKSWSGALDPLEFECDREAKNRLYEKVKNQAVNLAQALAERAQTAQLFGDTVQRVAKGIRQLKRGNLKGATQTFFPTSSKKLANDWLVYQYGVKPLLSDLEGVAKHLGEPEPVIVDIIAKRKRELPATRVYNTSGPTLPAQTEVWVTGHVEVTYKVRIRVTNTAARDMTRLGFGNIPALLYELTAYSFVVDWVLPVGDYLQNMDAFDHVEIVSIHKTVFKKEWSTMSRIFRAETKDGYAYTPAACVLIGEKTSCVRSIPLTVPPLPLPAFQDPVSKGHIANAMALIRQRFK